MIEWMTDYWWLSLIALLIGIATAYWMWCVACPEDLLAPVESDTERTVEPPKPLEARKPDIAAAKPMNFKDAPGFDTGKAAKTAVVAGAAGLATAAVAKPAAPVKAAAVKAAPVAKAPVVKAKEAPKPAVKTATVAKKPAVKADPVKTAATKATPAKVAVPKPKATPAVAALGGVMNEAGKPKIRGAGTGTVDNLELIKGVGSKLNTLLISLGITRFAQIASWTKAEITEVDHFLGNFTGRIERDNWVDQAGYLASGDLAGFAKKYGELGSEIK